jgi:hypothetical protein
LISYPVRGDAHRRLQHRWQLQQRQVMGDGRLVDAQTLGDRRVRVARTSLSANQARQVEWRQAMTLLALGRLCVEVGRCIAH